MQQYLTPSEYIDWQHPAILEKAESLSRGAADQIEVAKVCFEWVRDNIRHSRDYRDDTITCRASDVLLEGTGYCYAKSHLLAALLRANGIPAGLCYQRLSKDDNGPPFCLHGLNAIYLPGHGWYRADPRGNKAGVNAQFRPPIEKLAFVVNLPGEADLPEIWAEPLQPVTEVLRTHKGYKEVWENLPDTPLINERI
jgi:transglutaminase-like putative cysteine protease